MLGFIGLAQRLKLIYVTNLRINPQKSFPAHHYVSRMPLFDHGKTYSSHT